MTGKPYSTISVAGTVLLFLVVEPAPAQWQPGYQSAQPPGTTCQCWQPVVQQVYQTVPVTQYQPMKQTVERPVVDTTYEDQQYTAYRPITETKTAEIPTLTYQNVTEYQMVQHDYGQWITQHQPIYRPQAWEYDNRVSVMGWLNRTGYKVRSAVMPRYTSTRHYIPNVVEQPVPVTRQVAIPGTRSVQYQVTRMEAYTATRQVAVPKVRYVKEEITTLQPVTVMKTIPMGSRVAYAPMIPGSATALRPSPDSNFAKAPADGSGTPKRTANSSDGGFNDQDNSSQDVFPNSSGGSQIPGRRTSVPLMPRGDGSRDIRVDRRPGLPPTLTSERTVPTVVRVGRWVARRTNDSAIAAASTLTIAGTDR